MREPAFIECKGCWRLLLGFSTREGKEVITDKAGDVKAVITKPLPAHDLEVCPVCGAEYEFPPLDERRPDDDVKFSSVLYRFGPPSWPEEAEENLCLRQKNYSEQSSRW